MAWRSVFVAEPPCDHGLPDTAKGRQPSFPSLRRHFIAFKNAMGLIMIFISISFAGRVCHSGQYALWDVLEQSLPKRQLEALQLRLSGLTCAEISTRCGITARAVEKRFERIKCKVSMILKN